MRPANNAARIDLDSAGFSKLPSIISFYYRSRNNDAKLYNESLINILLSTSALQ
jgi:hypothetical protein